MTDPLDAVFVSGAEARLLELRDYVARMDADKQLALKELIDSAVEYRLSVVSTREMVKALSGREGVERIDVVPLL